MAFDITAASVATLIASTVATSVAIYLNRRNALKSLHDQLDNLLKISIQYPYLESNVFGETWPRNRNSEDEKYIRYELYCTLLFNFLERFCKYHGYSNRKIFKELNVKEWARQHKLYWLSPSGEYDNIEGYAEEFRNLINSYIK